jgi:HAD superfamily hydrolase (TIGR01549 family)
MENNIKAILFDVGNTLRIVLKEQDFIDQAEKELMELTQTTETHDAFFEKLESRWKAYRKYSKTSLLDASEMELWTQWMLPDYPTNLIAKNAARLTRLWRNHDGRRVARDDVKSTVAELHKRGYVLGIIANTVTETEIPDWMVEDDVVQYFKVTLLSAKVRIRKPMPEIYWLASKLIDVAPENCAYIGDNPVRDVEGTIKAGYGCMIRLIEESSEKAPADFPYKSNYEINSLSELLDIFPPLNAQ